MMFSGHRVAGFDLGEPFGVEGFNIGRFVKGALKDVGKVAIEPGKLTVEAVKDPKKFAHDVGRIGKEFVKIDKFVLEQAQGIVSLIPGVGTAISVSVIAAIVVGLAALGGGIYWAVFRQAAA